MALQNPPELDLMHNAGHVFLAWPILQFAGIGILGGLAGYFFLQEIGKLDNLGWRMNLCVLARRMILGASIGVIVYVGWADSAESRSLWLLSTGVITTSPIDMIKKTIEVAQNFMAKKAGTS